MLKLERRTLKKLAGSPFHSLLQLKESLSEVFHENTKLTPLRRRAFQLRYRSPDAPRLLPNPYKVYTLMDQVELGAAEPRNDLERTIAARRSVRKFTPGTVSREELSRLLFFAYGETGRGLRAVPSGGALYPLELYVVARHVEGLDEGIYHYDVEHHRLDVLRRGACWDELAECVNVGDVDSATATMAVVITAIFRRTTMKYEDRGYRMVLVEAGEVGQNLSLLGTSLGLGSCMLGGFFDDALGRLLDVDGIDEAPLLPIVFGRMAVAGTGEQDD